MRLIFAVVAPLFFMLAAASSTPETCVSRAQKCVDRWGAPRATCYDSFRLAACEKTGKYVAPNGNVWPANRRSPSSSDPDIQP